MDEEGKTFERRATVLERNPFWRALSLALLVLGPLAFAAAAAKLFPPGIFGLHATVVGLGVLLTQRRHNHSPQRTERVVRAAPEGVFVDGKLVAARDTIGDGFFQPRAASRESEDPSSVRLLDKRRGILFEVELAEHEALRFLRALGLDPASRRAEFRGASPVFPTLGRQIGGFFAALGAGILVGVVGAVVHVNLVPVLPLLLVVGTAVGLVPSKITVGVDGVLFRWLWTKKFVPMSDIRDVGVADDNAFRITLSSGREEVFYTGVRHRNENMPNMHANRDAILARIREALATFRHRGTKVDATALVARGSRSRTEWLDALDKLGGEGGGYREAVVRSEDLLRVVEDPTAPADARAGAALVLQESADDDARARVRVAAEASASPKLRVALDAAAGGAEKELREAIDELAEEDEEARAARG